MPRNKGRWEVGGEGRNNAPALPSLDLSSKVAPGGNLDTTSIPKTSFLSPVENERGVCVTVSEVADAVGSCERPSSGIA